MDTTNSHYGSRDKAERLQWHYSNSWDRTTVGRVQVGIRPADGYIHLSATETDGSKTTLTLKTDDTIAFQGVEVPLQDYDTIPPEFRYALQAAFPKLIVRSAIAELEPFEPFEPEFTPVEILPPGDLIPVDTSSGEPRTDARALHASLGSKQRFTDWFDNRKDECDLVKDQDFGVCVTNLGSKGRGGHNAIDYWLTLDAAKEMAMMERNEQGKAIRRYLIEVEKRFRAHQTATSTPQRCARRPGKNGRVTSGPLQLRSL